MKTKGFRTEKYIEPYGMVQTRNVKEIIAIFKYSGLNLIRIVKDSMSQYHSETGLLRNLLLKLTLSVSPKITSFIISS